MNTKNWSTFCIDIEDSIRELWKRNKAYEVHINSNETYFICDFFPYPSAAGLHIGHPLGYISTDIYARYKKMRDFNVLYSMGFDAFGLPAEQYAIQTGQHPEITTNENIKSISNQLKNLSLSHDENRVFSTTDSEYYKWTQWIFLQMYDSFFDHTEVWYDKFNNKIQGKAKNISILRKYLQSQKWIIQNGVPVPNNDFANENNSIPKPSKNEIEKALNEARLAYVANVKVNWCAKLGTVLSNEEVTADGLSERGNYPVTQKSMQQWMLRITKYAFRLINNLQYLNWPENISTMQKNWIGESRGVEITFESEYGAISVFTTRPDTIFGVFFIGLAPEHCIAQKIAKMHNLDLSQLQNSTNLNTKIGIKTGIFVKHVITQQKIEIWIVNYVLHNYGTGAIMGVPAHDTRDFEFAKKYNIECKPVIIPTDKWLLENYEGDAQNVTIEQLHDLWKNDSYQYKTAYTEVGDLYDFAKLNMNNKATINEICDWFNDKGYGKCVIKYKLRDWLFSRQRYWGEPFPIVRCAKTNQIYPVHIDNLPVLLPKQMNFEPEYDVKDPIPPLQRNKDWTHVKGVIQNGAFLLDENGSSFIRETNTMPNWAGSCWYYLRYMDAKNKNEFVNFDTAKYWSGDSYGAVDLYVGGAEHAVLHLLYARFWHMVLFDLGHVPTPEPFQKLLNPGMITANAYRDKRGVYVDVNLVNLKNVDGKEVAYHAKTEEKLEICPGKMGKRYKNGVNPMQICEKYGVDVFRLHMMYMGPLSQTRPWNLKNIVGMERFCNSLWRIFENSYDLLSKNFNENISKSSKNDKHENYDTNDNLQYDFQKMLNDVTLEMENLRFNTAIAFIITFCNKYKILPEKYLLNLLRILAPFIPHFAEYWYMRLRESVIAKHCKYTSILHEKWPKYDISSPQQNVILVVTINGRFKATNKIDKNATDENIIEKARKLALLTSETKYVIVRKEKIIVNFIK
mgnify:CR=1 FL=1